MYIYICVYFLNSYTYLCLLSKFLHAAPFDMRQDVVGDVTLKMKQEISAFCTASDSARSVPPSGPASRRPGRAANLAGVPAIPRERAVCGPVFLAPELASPGLPSAQPSTFSKREKKACSRLAPPWRPSLCRLAFLARRRGARARSALPS